MADVLRLLTYANRRKVARDLTEQGYKVSGETLNRWVRDQSEMPKAMHDAILRLFGLPTGQEETAPPWWGEAAESLVDRIEERMMPSAESAIPADQLQEIVDGLVARLGLPEPLDDEAPAVESAEPQGAAHKAAKRPR